MATNVTFQVVVSGLDIATLTKFTQFINSLNETPIPAGPITPNKLADREKAPIAPAPVGPAPKAPRVRSANQMAHDAEMKAKSALRKELGMVGFGKDPADLIKKFDAEWKKRSAKLVAAAAPAPAEKKVPAKGAKKQGTPEYDEALNNHQAKVEGKTAEEVAAAKTPAAAPAAKKSAKK